jgi:hypothetical protein
MPFLRRLPPLFYLGLFPVACLLWLWADSRVAYNSWYYCSGPQFQFGVMSARSSLQLSTFTLTEMRWPEKNINLSPQATGPMGRFSRVSMPSARASRLFPGTHSEDVWFNTPAGVMLDHCRNVPIWLMLLCYLPLWLLPAWWQARRRRRKIAAGMPVGGEGRSVSAD